MPVKIEQSNLHITFDRGGRIRHDSWQVFGKKTEWMVELTPVDHPSMSVIEIVEANCFDEAVFNAFFTRNIPDSWIVTHVEEG